MLIVALLCGVLWRAELEWRWGWATLEWAWQFYWAFPVGTALFVAWVAAVARVPPINRLVVGLLAFFLIGFEFFWCYLRYAVVRWIGPYPDFLILAVWMLPLFWALLPLVFGWLCRWHGIRVHFGLHVLSSVLFVVSWPVAVWLLEVVDHRGGADLIHALKSGFVIPLLVVSLGFPLLGMRRAS